MLFAQVGMGMGIDFLLVFWCAGCAALLAVGAAILTFLAPSYPALGLGVGVGTCLMTTTTVGMWLWFDYEFPKEMWMRIGPLITLAIGFGAVIRGIGAIRRKT